MQEAPIRAAIIPVTPFQQNCSLVWCSKTMRGVLVDPGGDLDKLKDAVAKAGVTLEKILLTHGWRTTPRVSRCSARYSNPTGG